MFEFIFSLSIGEVVLVNIGLIAVNLLYGLLMKSLIVRRYNKSGSVEETLYLQTKLNRYGWLILIILSSLISALTVAPYTYDFGEWGLVIVLGVAFLIFIVSAIGNQLILFETNRLLRKTTTTRKGQTMMLVRILIFTIIPVFLFFMVVDYASSFAENGDIGRFLKYIIPILVYIIFSLVLPLLNKYVLKAVPMEESSTREELLRFSEKSGIGKVGLFTWPMKDNRHANALVSGLIHKDIFISDYLLENMSLNEVKSILAHEIGHIKKHHLWIRTALVIGAILIFPLIGDMMDWYEEIFTDIPIWLGLTLLAVLFISYFGFLTYYISRVQERQADAYVLNLDIAPKTYIAALYKLARLNNLVMKFGKLDEKLQTHPSIAKRIRWIMEKGEVSEEEVEALKEEIDREFMR